MKEQDKLRNTLREHYDNQEVPFSENDWEQASAFLEAARRGRKKRYAVLIFLTLISGALLLVFNVPESKDTKQLQASLASKPTVNPEIASLAAVPSLPVMEEFKNNKSALAPYKKQNSGTNGLPDSQSPQKVAKPQQVLIHTKSQGPPASEPNFSAAHPVLQNTAMPEEVPTEQTPLQIAVSMTAIKNNHQHAEKENKETPPAVKETIETKPVKPEGPATGQDLSPLRGESQVLAADLTQSKGTPDLNDAKKETQGLDTMPIVLVPKSITVTPDDLRPKNMDVVTHKEEIVEQDTLPAPALNNPFVRDGIFYEVGAAGYYGWKGPEKHDARGLSPVVGIHYLNRLSSRSAFSFGVQYLQVRNLTNSSKTSRVSTYIYGEQSRVTVITPSTLHYLVAPLRLQFHIDRKNSIGIGMNVAYLMNVDARVTTYDEKPGFNENYKTIKQGRYMDGFSWYDSQLAFCYRRRIFNSLALQAEVFIGLMDVKQDDFFGLNQKERNSGAKLSLVYYVFRKKGNE